jgi:hypothetical protein
MQRLREDIRKQRDQFVTQVGVKQQLHVSPGK